MIFFHNKTILKFHFAKKDSLKGREKKNIYAQCQIDELKNLLHGEVDNILNAHLLMVTDNKQIFDYPTEKGRQSVALNIGYGGAPLQKDGDRVAVGSSPYLGISLPFGNAVLGSKFWRNTSLTTGVFLNDFENLDGLRVTGPIVGRPVYLGLGYRMLDFLRLSAGVTALQDVDDANNFSFKKAYLQPFIGISVEINVWMGLGKNRL